MNKENEVTGDPKCWECGVLTTPTNQYNVLRCDDCKKKRAEGEIEPVAYVPLQSDKYLSVKGIIRPLETLELEKDENGRL